jgi:hypothetical protein
MFAWLFAFGDVDLGRTTLWARNGVSFSLPSPESHGAARGRIGGKGAGCLCFSRAVPSNAVDFLRRTMLNALDLRPLRMKKNILLALGIALLGTLPASAESVICSYVARLSARDHRASDGYALRDVAAIIRQDRANFHKFRIRDEEDEADSFFSSVKNRENLEGMLRRRKLIAGVAAAVINGNPLVQVEVVQTDDGFTYIRLEVL